METIEEILDTSKWIDPPTEKGTYERFFIRDKETHEWFRGLSRESLAKFVLGEKTLNIWNTKYEPLRDEIHHLIVTSVGTACYDSKEYEKV